MGQGATQQVDSRDRGTGSGTGSCGTGSREQRDGSGSPPCLSEAVIPGLRKVSLSKLEGVVEISPSGVVSDFDGTYAIGSEGFHDSHIGRFAWAVTRALPASQFLSLSHERSVRYLCTGSIFDATDWSPYAEAAGQREDAVIRQIARTHIQEREGKTDVEERYVEELVVGLQGALRLMLKSDNIVSQLAEATQVTLDQGIAAIYRASRENGVPFIICSASSSPIVKLLWQFLHRESSGISEPPIRGNAAKKLDEGFSGKDVREACLEASIVPEQAIMLGDSIGDVGAALLAGIPDVYIRLPLAGLGEERARQVESAFTQEVLNLPRIHGEIRGRVHLIDDFKNLKIV